MTPAMIDLLSEPVTIETAWRVVGLFLSSLLMSAPAETCPGVENPG